jgi:chemotaxis signal transduction protein
VLVVEDGDLFCGLVVEQSFGMLQFELEDHEPGVGEEPASGLTPWLRGLFRQSGRVWRVMDVRALVREPAFFEVAARSGVADGYGAAR